MQNVVKDVKQKLDKVKTTIEQLEWQLHESKSTMDIAGPPTTKVEALREHVEAQRAISTKAKKATDTNKERLM